MMVLNLNLWSKNTVKKYATPINGWLQYWNNKKHDSFKVIFV